MSITTESCQQGQIESLKKQLAQKEEENKQLKNDLRLCAEGLIPSDLIQRGIVETCREKVKQLEEENTKLKAKNKGLTILKQEAESRSFCYEADIKELEKNLKLSEDKGQAKSDIIINMLDRLIKDANIDDGFYIGRQWGDKYSDEHNKIINEEFQELLKDINQDLDGEFEIRTNGYQFDFHYPESEDEEEEV